MKFYKNKYPISDNIEYVIDYVCDNPSGENYYYQLVRICDNAILYASRNIDDIIVQCWRVGITKKQVTII